MRGDLPLARELLAEGRQTIEESGLTLWAALNAQEAYLVELLADTSEAAVDTLRQSFETLNQVGERAYLSSIAGFLAHALYSEGRDDEALRFSRESEDAAAPDDVLSQMLWRTARAKIRARHGDLEGAEALAREAVRLGEPTDLLNTRADVHFDLAEVLALAGRREQAVRAVEEAARLYERKGNLTALNRARSLAQELAVASPSA
jgi:tetratricopeptide (TPR) repeat protein